MKSASARPTTPKRAFLSAIIEAAKEMKRQCPRVKYRNMEVTNKGNGTWVRNKKAAEKDGVEVATLATYRKAELTSEDNMLGKDQYGRIWRRRGTPNSHPWYLKSTLHNPA